MSAVRRSQQKSQETKLRSLEYKNVERPLSATATRSVLSFDNEERRTKREKEREHAYPVNQL